MNIHGCKSMYPGDAPNIDYYIGIYPTDIGKEIAISFMECISERSSKGIYKLNKLEYAPYSTFKEFLDTIKHMIIQAKNLELKSKSYENFIRKYHASQYKDDRYTGLSINVIIDETVVGPYFSQRVKEAIKNDDQFKEIYGLDVNNRMELREVKVKNVATVESPYKADALSGIYLGKLTGNPIVLRDLRMNMLLLYEYGRIDTNDDNESNSWLKDNLPLYLGNSSIIVADRGGLPPGVYDKMRAISIVCWDGEPKP